MPKVSRLSVSDATGTNSSAGITIHGQTDSQPDIARTVTETVSESCL